MAKQSKVRDYDQFIVRLPPGMRDRIKLKAERAGMSMNEAVVWALERAFPAPASITDRMSELANLMAVLKGGDAEAFVDRMIDEMTETIEKVANYRLRSRPDFRNMVADRYERLVLEEYERLKDEESENPFADEESSGPPFLPD